MNTVAQVMAALKKKGNPLRIQAFAPHGAPENIFGVSAADMKVIARNIKGEQDLACKLYETGNADAMFLAGLVADGALMTKKQLDSWARGASWQMVSEQTVPRVAAQSKHARDLAMKWISSKRERVASAGWATYSSLVAAQPDEALDLAEIKTLLKSIEKNIDAAANRVRFTMNGFVIAVGSFVAPLHKQALATAKRLGRVDVDMHGTTCKVPLATQHIAKAQRSGKVGNRRRTTKR